jgi:HEAT repeat protein
MIRKATRWLRTIRRCALSSRYSIDYARDHAALASEVLATSADARHRRWAAVILGYAPDKRAAATALIRGVSDPDDGVRNNATRALGVIATYSVAASRTGHPTSIRNLSWKC